MYYSILTNLIAKHFNCFYCLTLRFIPNPVSYTHLDVYKRQVIRCCKRLVERNSVYQTTRHRAVTFK